jgi:hypothetical protein
MALTFYVVIGTNVGGGEKELVTEGPKASLMEPA